MNFFTATELENLEKGKIKKIKFPEKSLFALTWQKVHKMGPKYSFS